MTQQSAAARPAPDAEFQALVLKRYAGDPRAIADLGARLVVGDNAPSAPVDGTALLEEAARQGDPTAWRRLSVIAATGAGRDQSWPDAFSALERAVKLGDPIAIETQRVLRVAGIACAADVDAWIAPPANCTVVHESPRIVTFPDFLAPALCQHFMRSTADRLVPAKVYDSRVGGLKVDPMRSNRCAPLSLVHTDLFMQVVRARIARASGVPLTHLEPPEVLHYRVGEHNNLHFDFLHHKLPGYEELIAMRGQRTKTFLVYLNDDYDGAVTEFPRIEVRFRGPTGTALLFDNALPDGMGDERTAHAGTPPTRGEKWVLSQWMRSRAQPIT
jgi:hypothetical protein